MTNNIENDFIKQLKTSYYELYIVILVVGGKNFYKNILICNIFIELIKIPSKTHDKMMGFIRLQWWRESLVYRGDKKINHPLIDNISYNLKELKYFENIISSLESELDEDGVNFESIKFIKLRYEALLSLLSPCIEENRLDIKEKLSESFFIIIEILINRNDKYIPLYTDSSDKVMQKEEILEKGESLNHSFQNSHLYRENILLFLISNMLDYNASKLKNNKSYNYEKKNKLGLLFYILYKSIVFKLKRIFKQYL